MKIFKLLAFVLTLSLALVSCSEDGNGDAVASVSGNKYESTYGKLAVVEPIPLNFEYKSKEELMAADVYNVIEFKGDGSFYMDDEKVGTWSQSGANLSLTYEEETSSATLAGDKVSMSYEKTLNGIVGTITVEYTKM